MNIKDVSAATMYDVLLTACTGRLGTPQCLRVLTLLVWLLMLMWATTHVSNVKSQLGSYFLSYGHSRGYFGFSLWYSPKFIVNVIVSFVPLFVLCVLAGHINVSLFILYSQGSARSHWITEMWWPCAHGRHLKTNMWSLTSRWNIRLVFYLLTPSVIICFVTYINL